MSDPSEQRLSGRWFNQLGSCLDVIVDGDGRLTGTFLSLVGGEDAEHAVAGFFAPDSDGPDGTVGFAVSWHSAHSVTVWSGHYRHSDDAIFTTWLLSEASSSRVEWRSTSVGHDEFRRSPSQNRIAPWLASSARYH